MIITLHEEGHRQDPKPRNSNNDIRLATVADLLETAQEVVKQATEGSKVLNVDIDAKLPKFNDREVVTGNIIGRGGFCIVRDLEKIRISGGGASRRGSFSSSKSGKADPDIFDSRSSWGMFGLCFGRDQSVEDHSGSMRSMDMDCSFHSKASGYSGVTKFEASKHTREYVAMRSKKSRRTGARYVLKSLNKGVDKITYMKGNVDIAMEAKFLAALDHPNIIELVAVSASKPCTPGYFLILEKMTDTLTGRIKSWMDRERMCKSIFGRFSGGHRKEIELYHERIAASYDIASGLFYLHNNGIVFRDLKPDNIGFDRHNRLKLFDFGLAKELKEEDRRGDDTYRNMTAMTGAIRYMAPEVGLGQPYNSACDVYSWSMVMWFILALEPPFGFFTESMIASRVHKKGVRPSIFRRWNEVIGEMLRCAWDADLHQRPNFLEITLVLKQELAYSEQASIKPGSTVIASLGSTGSNTFNNTLIFERADPSKVDADDDSVGPLSCSSTMRRPESRTQSRNEKV